MDLRIFNSGYSEIPAWSLQAAAVVFVVFLAGSLVWGFVLQLQYTRPYTLEEATSKQKWLWSIHLAFWSSICLLDAGFFLLFLGLCGAPLGVVPKVCIGSFLFFFPLMIPFWRLSLNVQLDYYHYLNWAIRFGKGDRLFASPLLRLRKSLLGRFSQEFRRFFQEGYPDDVDPEKKS